MPGVGCQTTFLENVSALPPNRFFLETRIPELQNTEILREMAGIDGLLPVHGADLCLHLSFYRFY